MLLSALSKVGQHLLKGTSSWLPAAWLSLSLGCGDESAADAGGSGGAVGIGGMSGTGPSASTGSPSMGGTSSGATSASTAATETSAGASNTASGGMNGTASMTSGAAIGVEGATSTTTGTEGGASSGSGGTSSTPGTTTSGAGGIGSVPFIVGADISFVQEEEDKGTVFADGGQQKDILEILTDHGFNYARLRLFHTPGNPNGYQYEFVTRAEPYCDRAHTIEMAQRVKAAGMGLLLDFHYSDTWADPDDQHKPADWENLDFSQLVTAVYDYTRDTLLAFQAANALPDMVQVGNEITPGMLHPDGHTYEPDNWDQLAELLTAGLSAVKEVDSQIQTMLHIDRGGDNETSRWWLGEALERGVQFDILGQSAYSAFHGSPSVWQDNFSDLVDFTNQLGYPNLKFVIAEYNGEKRAANDIMHDLPEGRGLGTFFWEPTASGEWGSAMFTWSGNVASANSSDFAIYDQIADDYGLR